MCVVHSKANSNLDLPLGICLKVIVWKAPYNIRSFTRANQRIDLRIAHLPIKPVDSDLANESHKSVVWEVGSVFVKLLLSDLLIFIVLIFDLVLCDRVKFFIIQITGQLKVFFLEILLVLFNVVWVIY